MFVAQGLNPKQLQINLTGFLEKNTSLFVKVRAPALSRTFIADMGLCFEP